MYPLATNPVRLDNILSTDLASLRFVLAVLLSWSCSQNSVLVQLVDQGTFYLRKESSFNRNGNLHSSFQSSKFTNRKFILRQF